MNADQDRERAISKTRKLLRLAESPNYHEAQSARRCAQEIIDKHHLTTADITPPAPPLIPPLPPQDPVASNPFPFPFAPVYTPPYTPPVYQAPPSCPPTNTPFPPAKPVLEDTSKSGPSLYSTTKRYESWVGLLASALGQYNACVVYLRRPKNGKAFSLEVVGHPDDIQATRKLFDFVMTEMAQATRELGKGNNTTWRNQCRLGMAVTLCERLTKALDEEVQGRGSLAWDPVSVVALHHALQQRATRLATAQTLTKRRTPVPPTKLPHPHQEPPGYREGRLAGLRVDLRAYQPLGALGAPA